MTVLTLLALTCAGLVQSAPPRDRPSSDRTHRIEFEDDQVRVLRVTLDPRERTTPADRPPAVLIFLTADRKWLALGYQGFLHRKMVR